MSQVVCETPEHGEPPHEQAPDCAWPHYIGPSAPVPAVGHPLTSRD